MFKNESLTDFSIESNRRDFTGALEEIDKKIKESSVKCFPVINGREIKTQTIFKREDPSDGSTVIGESCFASASHAEEAIRSLQKGQAAWHALGFEKRADIITKAAEIMKRERHALSALIVREAGKPWKEADADTAEAIDFCNYYSVEAIRLGRPFKTADIPGEDNIYFYKPRGITAVIAPWNFPLAIACGMTVAALVTGNTVVLKPAEQTSLIAFRLAKILLEAGVPPDAFAFLPGYGEEVGRAVVESPHTAMICFTGSKSVGLEIISKAAVLAPGQRHIKKVVAELGGKNCIIIDEDADPDEAIKGTIYSAFGFAGQKCSACSRVIAVGDIYSTFMSRLSDACADIIIGQAVESSTLVGPVIDRESQERIINTINNTGRDLTPAFSATAPAPGYFVPPTVFRDVPSTHPIWTEEIFGPVLACTQVKTFEEAVSLANDSQYALTGGVYSRSPKNIRYAVENFETGNLYINRSCTGALVCRQPFGGFKLSGIGSKAGGPDYLLQFMEPRCVTENTMRRGFAPE